MAYAYKRCWNSWWKKHVIKEHFFVYILIIFGGLECVGHSFAYVAHLFLGNVWIRTQGAAVASRYWYATNLATHLPWI